MVVRIVMFYSRTLLSWCQSNKLSLNFSKCKVMTFSRKLESVIHSYEINNTALDRCTEIKDLGVIFDVKLTFNSHVCRVFSESCKLLGFIIRTSKDFNNIETIVKL